MNTESIYQNQILFKVPLGFSELSARKLELDRLTDESPEVMQEYYLALSADFAAIDCPMMAARCESRAEQWRGLVRR